MTVSLADLGAPEAETDPLVRNGRYQIEYQGEKSWQRQTNFCPILENQFSLIEWKQRKVLQGAPVVIDRLADATDYKAEMALVEEALEAAGANIKRNYGSDVHDACENVEAGIYEPEDLADPLMIPDVRAYLNAIHAFDIETLEMEQVVVMPALGTAGRFDRIVRHLGVNKILDLKTGTLHPLQIAVQLAGYAHAEVIYNPDDKSFRPMPAVSQTEALVAHIPMHEGRCDIYSVNIELGWEYALLTKRVRDEVRKAKLTHKLKAQLRPAPAAVDARRVPPPSTLPAAAGVVEDAVVHAAPPTPATSPLGGRPEDWCLRCIARRAQAGKTVCALCADPPLNTAQIALFS